MTKFKLFTINITFEDDINDFTKNKKIIKWDRLESKNVLGGEIILLEYEEEK